MERIVKIFLILILFISAPVCCAEQMSLSTLITTQNNKYQDCVKVFNIDCVTLYYLTIGAINANRFQIDEIQSKSGYVLFTAVNKQFLATVTNVNTNQGMLKITPVDNNYYFQPGIVSNIFKFIDLKLNTKVQDIGFDFVEE